MFHVLWLASVVAYFVAKNELEEDDRKFLAKVNPKWFPELAAKAKALLGKKDSEFVVLYSEELGEHFMGCNFITAKNKIKQKYVLTNAFVNAKAPKNYAGTSPSFLRQHALLTHRLEYDLPMLQCSI